MNGTKTISLPGGDRSARYYQSGKGQPLLFLHSAAGLPGFTPQLEALSRYFTVTAPLMPGFGSSGEECLHDDVLKLVFWGWDFVDALKIERPILVGHSLGGMLAAEMAATEPSRVGKLVLAAPAGIWLDEHPTADFFAMTPQEIVAAAFHDPQSELARTFLAIPDDHQAAAETTIARIKGLAAAGRFLWPLGDRGLRERLYRVRAATLLLWGDSDRIIPPIYSEAFQRELTGAASVNQQRISAAGHELFAEQPEATITAIVNFCAS